MIDKIYGNYYGACMKRFLNILRFTLMLAIAVAPLGGAYAGTMKQEAVDTHCAKMQSDKITMADGSDCPHHKQADGSQPGKDGCEKNCSDCKAAHHVAGLTHCPMHTERSASGNAQSSTAVPHSCPHHDTSQPPRR
ncbi:MAG: hypothetical protein OEZ10_04815 [Gammaproteobacteria bacterium]|nr:hypothetical protein [Gammaproteobacteria bacterium]